MTRFDNRMLWPTAIVVAFATLPVQAAPPTVPNRPARPRAGQVVVVPTAGAQTRPAVVVAVAQTQPAAALAPAPAREPQCRPTGQLLLGQAPAVATGAPSNPQWLTSLADAQSQSTQSGKLILADFCGSDWCPYCIQLKTQVLDGQAFKDYAQAHLVLLEVDYPVHQQLAPSIQQQNGELKSKYGIDVLPTVLVLDSRGKELARFTGYGPGWLQALTAKADQLQAEDKPK